MSGSAFAVTHHAFSSGAGRTSDGNGSHASTLKSPSYTKSVSWQHYQKMGNAVFAQTLKVINKQADGEKVIQVPIDLYTKTEDGKQWLATHVDGLP
ncbi:ABC transporter periplasmic-binding protein yphF [Escherichia coli KTE186]|nr:ABC transporter periplasmic-binding protein yphF [Escherichia coli KTE186]